ncbi:MAG: substrate-binding domain-containing protein [Blastomonas fulva]|jgi:ABC-type molybdate transport system substrate-binding protein|uniref:substrate-binding domain-containing protein n=2 Tax=Sphingomonadaceae TaxID=41297 RepID=UPI0040345124
MHYAKLAALAAAVLSLAGAMPAAAQSQDANKVTDLGVYPPWQEGQNNDAAKRGFEFTIADADNLADFHGSPQDPLLSLYVGGNYFFAMAPLVAAFEQRYPEYKGRLYWETIPPGLLVRQMKMGGTITVGNMTWTVKPDVYLAGKNAVQKQMDDGLLVGPVVPYVTNTLAIMVPKGNPAKVTGLASLGNAGIKLAMPNPEFEGIARQISSALEAAGGKPLADKVYKAKVADGTSILTHIHHRQTPLWIMQGKAQAGVTWQSEVAFQMQAGHPIEGVEIPAAQNQTAIYAGAMAKDAPHPEAAKRWLEFIRSPEALAIFGRYGFKPYQETTR